MIDMIEMSELDLIKARYYGFFLIKIKNQIDR